MNTQALRVVVAAAAAGALVAVAFAAQGSPGRGHGHGHKDVRASLTGYSEVPFALSSPGSGSFRATIDENDQEIRYVLSYGGTPTTVSQAHIHFGSTSQAGGISTFLCTNLGNGPAGTQACPASGTITGVLTAADVIGPAAQGIGIGEFQELVNAIKAKTAYVNVHTAQNAGGEIRGQLR
jgi:CHRD domain-containing protein